MSLVEVMVAMSILSIGVLGFVGAFSHITKAIRVSRAGTLAANLVQEKVEVLKNQPYYKLALTTETVSDNNFSPAIQYDNINYGLEIINIGGITFKRVVQVTMAQVSNGLVTSVGYNYPDTGMKVITVYVMWQQDGAWKRIYLENVYENPVVDPLSGQIEGAVTDGVSAIGGAIVRVMENSDWKDTADASGDYAIATQPGTYSLRASSAGYYDQLVLGIDLSSSTSVTQNLTLTPIGTGTITGYAWSNPNLLIAHFSLSTRTVVGDGVQNTQVEFVELFNPTTFPINIGSDAGGSETKLHYYGESAVNDRSDMLNEGAFTNYVATFVPPLRSYLIASTSFFWYSDRYVHADAHYQGIKMRLIDAGSLEIERASDGHVWDLVGWNDNSGGNSARFKEGAAIPDPSSGGANPPQCNQDGMGEGWSAVRISSPASYNDTYGPAYDSGNNNNDFISTAKACVFLSPFDQYGVRNTTDSARAVIAGVPMIGANITADDLLGPTTKAYALPVTVAVNATTVTLTSNVAAFALEGVSTGTWSVVVASGQYSATISTLVVAHNASTTVVNGVSDPAWKVENYANAHLETMSTDGYISGLVTDISANPLSGVAVLAGGVSKNTGANGRYFVKVSSGDVFVIANPNNADPAFVESIQTASVVTGQLAVQDFTLTEGGVITGFISTDGSSILPNVQVAASIGGAQFGLGTSDSSGNFYIKNLPSGTYDVAPILDPMESYSPLSSTAAVTSGSTVSIGTFTVVGALGTLAGTVKNNGVTVTAGALILVSASAIPATPAAVVASSSPAQTPIYAASSLADGTFEVEVRGSTSTTYFVSAYIPTISGSSVVITTKTYAGISITADTATPLNIEIP